MKNEVLFEASDEDGNHLEVHRFDEVHLRIMTRANDGHWTTIMLDDPDEIVNLMQVLAQMLNVRIKNRF